MDLPAAALRWIWSFTAPVVDRFSQRAYMRITCRLLRARGVRFDGNPLWIALNAQIDVGGGATVTLGDRCVIAQDALILTHDYSLDRYSDLQGRENADSELVRYASVAIGSYAFIGARAIVLAGSQIGTGAVVAAGAVVTGDVPPNEVWAGNPARRITSTDEWFERSRDRYMLQVRRK